jgi:hydroxymethylbilane synthase
MHQAQQRPAHHRIIGTRGSKLALAQAEQVAAMLRQQHPDLRVELQIISTQGDRVLDVALSAVGDKGLFVKEIEVALLNGDVDLAVHSGKDLPSETPDGLTLAAFPARVDPRDVLILPRNAPATPTNTHASPLDILPRGARVGTSSLRRACQLRHLRPDLELLNVRGNVDTRLRKLDEGTYDALILAAAGLARLGLHERSSQPLPPEIMLPAVAQGTLIIETRADDQATRDLVATLDVPASRFSALAERAFLRRLEGGCQVPIAAFAEVDEHAATLHLRGLVGTLDGSQMVRGERSGPTSEAEQMGHSLAEELLKQGAETILADLRSQPQP